MKWEYQAFVYQKQSSRLVEMYPDQFTDDFDTNKHLVSEFTDVGNKRMRNWIAVISLDTNSAGSISASLITSYLFGKLWETGGPTIYPLSPRTYASSL